MKNYSYPLFPGSVIRSLLVISLFSIIISGCSQAQAAPAQLSVREGGGGLAMRSEAGFPKDEPVQSELDPQAEESLLTDSSSAPQPSPDGLGAGPEPQAVIIEPPADIPTEMPAAKQVPTEETVDQDLPVGPQIGYLAPDFSLQTPDGQSISLSDLRGRPVVISYWTSWCGPCENEMRILQGVYEQHQASGFTVLAVNAIEQDSLSDVTEMVARLGVTYPVVLDQGDQFAGSYQALFFPTSYFVDANGVIQDIALGDSPEPEFRARVDGFLAGQ